MIIHSAMVLPTLVAAATAAPYVPAPFYKRQAPTVACASLKPMAPEGAAISKFTAKEQRGACVIDTFVTHGSSGDNVHHATWLPLTNWNGRYMGNGGGGMTAGSPTSAPASVAQGYASGATDAGLPNSFDGGVWANNTQLILNFAHLAVHEFTVIGKDLAKQFYGQPIKYAYWNGCSTGGRQGYMEAQRYPTDYNGVYAASPAINWDRFHVAMMWPYIVQNTEGEFVPQRVFDQITAASIKACAGPDNLIQDPNLCTFDATKATGLTATAKQAMIWQKIAIGPVDTTGKRLWSGIQMGTSYSAQAGSTPFGLSSSWIRNFVMKEPDLDLKNLTYASFVDIFAKSHHDYDDLIGTDNPNLSPFQKAGGKLLSWHGWADTLIFGNGTYDYRTRVDATMGGISKVDEFYRLFMAPGVGHCGGGGPTPSDPFGALVNWVEKGEAPEVLPAAGGGQQRNLCRYPMLNKYSGSGAVTAAASWGCA